MRAGLPDSAAVTPLLSTRLLRTQSDKRLVELVREGHELAFQAIVERYRRPLRAHVGRLLPDVRTDDVLQQAFLNAWSSLVAGAEVRNLRPWLYQVAHNAGLNALREKGYDYVELEEALHDDGAQSDVETRAAIRETLRGVARLPDRQREALLRMAVEGRSEHQVAESLGVSEGAVRQLVFRARQTLRAAATAITPVPLARWAAANRSWDEAASVRIAELASGGAGTAGAVAGVSKAVAVIAVTGGVAAGIAGGGERPASSAESRSHAEHATARASQGHRPRSAGEGSSRRASSHRGGSMSAEKDRRSRPKTSSPRSRPRAAREPARSSPRRRRRTSPARTASGNRGVRNEVRRPRSGTTTDEDTSTDESRSTDEDGLTDEDGSTEGDGDSNVNSNDNTNENDNRNTTSDGEEGDGEED